MIPDVKVSVVRLSDKDRELIAFQLRQLADVIESGGLSQGFISIGMVSPSTIGMEANFAVSVVDPVYIN
jgi:spore germination protein YaaH